jgi:electron transport complex protein RnfA
MDMMKIIAASFAAIFINNFVLDRFLGLCPFFTVSKKPSSAFIIGVAVTVMMVVSCAALYPLNRYVLVQYNLDRYLQTAVFVISAYLLVQGTGYLMKRLMPDMSKELFSYFPLLASSCAVLRAAFIVVRGNYDIAQAIVFSFSSGAGFTIAMIMMSSVKERTDAAGANGARTPDAFKGLPVSFISAALMALSMYGLRGILK